MKARNLTVVPHGPLKRGRVGDDERMKIRELWNLGIWYAEIAEMIGRSEDVVEDVVHNHYKYKRPRYTPSACKLARALYEYPSCMLILDIAHQLSTRERSYSEYQVRRMLLLAATPMRRPGYRETYVADRKVPS